MSETEQSQRIHRLLCELIVLPSAALPPSGEDPVSQVVDFITQHLFEDISVADHCSLCQSESLASVSSIQNADRIFSARIYHTAPH